MRFLKFIWVILGLLLGACSMVNSQISANPEINPDIHGTPSPVALSVFELTNLKAFEASSLYALYGNAHQSLGSTLVDERNVVISPGEILQVSLPYYAQVRYVAYVAAFRNFDHVIWRAVVPITTKPSFGQSILVRLDATGVHVLPEKTGVR